MTNVERLEKAGLVKTHHPLTPEEIAQVNQLSQAEVDALVSVKAKLGDKFFEHKERPGVSNHMGTLFV